MVMLQGPVACRRPSSKVQFKVEEEGIGRERNGRTTLLSGQGRALPRPNPLAAWQSFFFFFFFWGGGGGSFRSVVCFCLFLS